MSFHLVIPGKPVVSSPAFQQTAPNRWVVTLEDSNLINELVAFLTEPLTEGFGLACYIAAPPFEANSWHYLGSLRNDCPSVIFKPRYVWTSQDAIPTTVQFGVEMAPLAELAVKPPEMVSSEVLEAARRIAADLYRYMESFGGASTAGNMLQVPSNVLDRWLERFNNKCQREGLDWLLKAAA